MKVSFLERVGRGEACHIFHYFAHNAGSMATAAEDTPVPLRQRAGAAGIAACVSAIVVNPLDVVKIRIQAQMFNYQASSAVAPYKSPTSYNGVNLRRPLQISLATATATQGCPPKCPTIGNVSAKRLMCAPECNVYTSSLDVMRKIVRQEAGLALFQGWHFSGLVCGTFTSVCGTRYVSLRYS